MSRPEKTPIIAGERFGRLTAVRSLDHTPILWLCRCDCGQFSAALKTNLRSGGTRSCGCIRHDTPNNQTHGLSNTRTYRIWQGMHDRCRRQAHKSYQYYGARGIRVCRRWESFESFLSDMGAAPKGLTIERRDNNGDYTPRNCIWADRFAQARNTRATKLTKQQAASILALLARGHTHRSLAERFGVSPGHIWNIHNGKCWVDAR